MRITAPTRYVPSSYVTQRCQRSGDSGLRIVYSVMNIRIICRKRSLCSPP